MSSRKRKIGVTTNKYASAGILLNDTVLILQARKSRSKRELLNLGEFFKAFHHFGGRLLWKQWLINLNRL